MSEPVVWLTIFVLSVFVGVEVIAKVSSTLHTPLMSGANAIHGIILLGAILVSGYAETTLQLAIGLIAVLLASGTHVRFLYGADAKPAFLLAFPWRITLGTFVTYAIAVCFRTPDSRVRSRAATEATHS